MSLKARVVTAMSAVGGAFAAASRPLRREIELWRWRRNFRYRLPAPIQDPREPSRERSNGPVRVRLLSYAIGTAPPRRFHAAAGGAPRAGARIRPS